VQDSRVREMQSRSRADNGGTMKINENEECKISNDEAEVLRCCAHEIIIKLYRAKKRLQIDLLRTHCERAIEELDADITEPRK
jgi:hypothetical protein